MPNAEALNSNSFMILPESFSWLLNKMPNDIVKLIISRSHPAVCRTPVVQACYITSWVLLQPSALSGCPLAAYVSATAASSANVSSGNKQPSQRPSATPHLRQHHGRLSIQRTSNPEHLLYYMMKQLCRLTIRKLIIYLFTFSSACYKPALFQQLKMM